MRNRSVRLSAAALALIVITSLVAGCGGGDDSAAQEVVTVTERVTVTAPEGVEESAAATDEPTDGSGETSALSGDEVEAAVETYRGFFGFTEEQARCLVEEAQRLQALDPDDPTAFLAAGGLELLSRCDIDIEDVVATFGGLPE